jgi:HAD superfamily hydrolase (TIGR01459 family)
VTRVLASLSEIASDYGAIVFDQWGVLHDGSAPYSMVLPTLEKLRADGHRLAVLSNSGKRAKDNEDQLARFGIPPDLFTCVMTSGEALWRAFATGEMAYTRLHAVTRGAGDAEAWADGLGVSFVPIDAAEAVLLMGLSDTGGASTYDDVFAAALGRGLPVLCSNPDRTAPRAGGAIVVMPGTLAHQYVEDGGAVHFVGKPYPAVFRAVEAALDMAPSRLLMVGDSLEHDIAGAHAAGWDSAFVCGGLHAQCFESGEVAETVAALARAMDTPLPEFTLDTVR